MTDRHGSNLFLRVALHCGQVVLTLSLCRFTDIPALLKISDALCIAITHKIAPIRHRAGRPFQRRPTYAASCRRLAALALQQVQEFRLPSARR